MDTTLSIIGAICILVGVFGCVISILPGPPLAFFGLFLQHFTSYQSYSTSYLIVLLVIVIAVTALDYVLPVFGSKAFGVSKYGVVMSFIGMVAGLLLFPPFGAIIGIIVGAIAGEYMSGKKHKEAIKAGFVTFALTIFMMIVRLSIASYIAWEFFHTLYKVIFA